MKHKLVLGTVLYGRVWEAVDSRGNAMSLLQKPRSRSVCLTLKMLLALQHQHLCKVQSRWSGVQHGSTSGPLGGNTPHNAEPLHPHTRLEGHDWFFFQAPKVSASRTLSSSCQEHAWEWRVSKWNHLKASASTKTPNSDFKHKCSKDIEGISSEMKIRLWAFPKRKNYLKYDGSASVELKSVWVKRQEKTISVKLALIWALLDDRNMMHTNQENKRLLPGYTINYIAVCVCMHVNQCVCTCMCVYKYSKIQWKLIDS